MKQIYTLSNTISSGIKAFLALSALTMVACSSVRDATDWVPGVDSNEEIQAEKEAQLQEARAKEREAYENKAVFAPTITDSAAESDAKINVGISQKLIEETSIKREDIGIEVNAGVVTLSGSVNSEAMAVKAIAIAKSTKGVAKVISRLVVIKLRTSEKE